MNGESLSNTDRDNLRLLLRSLKRFLLAPPSQDENELEQVVRDFESVYSDSDEEVKLAPIPPSRPRHWHEEDIIDFISKTNGDKVAVATCESIRDAQLFRAAVYNYRRAKNITSSLHIRISGCDVIASTVAPTYTPPTISRR